MADKITSEDVQALVEELKKLTRQQRSDSSGSSRRPDPTAFERGAGEKVSDIERRIEALKREAEVRGEMSRLDERAILQLEEQKRLAQEMQRLREEKADQLEKIARLEKELKKASGDKQLALEKDLLQERLRLEEMGNYDDLAKQLSIELERLRKRQSEMNREADRGAGKFNLLTKRFTKVGGAAEEFAMHMPLSVSELKNFGFAMIDSVMSGEIFSRLLTKLIAEGFNLSVELDKVNAGLSRQTALFQETGTIMDQQARIIRDVERSNAVLGATTAETGQAMGALQSSMADFTRMSRADQKSILNTATVMQELGISAQTSAQIFDKATKSLGYQNSQLRGIADELHATAQSLGVPFSQIADDFNMVATELAFYGETAIDVFKELSKQSKATGLSMQQLLKIGGQAFNTFDGAAQKVGRLNAILGGPYLNSIDLLNASEAERIDLIKQSMDASGQMFNDLSKYEQMAIADALGVSTEEARRLFGELSAAQEMDIREKEKMEETARKAQATMDKLANAFNSLIVSLDIIIGPLSFIVEKFSQLIATPVGKFIGQAVLYIGGLVGIFVKLGKSLMSTGMFLRRLGASMRKNPFKIFGKDTREAGKKINKFGKTVLNTGKTMSSTGAMAEKVSKPLGKLKGVFSNFKMPNFATFAGGLGKVANVVKRYAYPLDLAVQTFMSFRDNFNLFGESVDAAGFITAFFIAIGDAAARATDSLVNFGVFLANLLLPKNFEIPKLDLAGAIRDAVAEIDMGFISETFSFIFGGGGGSGGTINTPKNPTKVNDAIITTKGEVIKPNKQDTIFAAKPGGPIIQSLMTSTATNNTVNNTSMKQQAPNVNVIVKIGEKQIKNLVVDTFLNDPEVSAAASGFGGR
jgi:regulator of sigma D